MVIVTRITTQKRSNNRYNIYINDGTGEKYGFSVDEDILIKHRLRKGMQLDNGFIEELMELDSKQQAYIKAIQYLSYRMRTKKEMYDYLEKKEVPTDDIPSIIQRLVDQNLLDDTEFAEMFVRSRVKMTNKGPALIKTELLEKGISLNIAQHALTSYTYDVQFEKALKSAEKRMNRSNNNSFRKQIQQLQAYLMRNGFTKDVMNDVIAHVEENFSDASDSDVIAYQGEKLRRKYEKKFTGNDLQFKLKEGLYRQGFTTQMIERYLDESE